MNLTASGRGRKVAFHRRRFRATMLRFTSSDPISGDMPPNTIFALRRALSFSVFVVAVVLSCFVLYKATLSFDFFSLSSALSSRSKFVFPELNDSEIVEYRIERVLKDAAMEDSTVILTTLNEAWAAPGSIIDLFLESFRIGDHTHRLLNHLVIVALDRKAYSRCLVLHIHCVALVTEGVDFSREAYFMTSDYLKMMWRRIDFLRSVLEMGYNFVFTDADIMWFRDPFPRFYKDADFQIACDLYLGNSFDIQNRPNGGFSYVNSNNRSIEFYKFWFSSREINPGYHDQDVLNMIKFDHFLVDIGLKMRFLSTAYFGGLCEPSEDLNQVCTMHANCCFGLDSKIHDLKIMLQDWRQYMSLPPDLKRASMLTWGVPQKCSLDSLRQNDAPEKQVEEAAGH